MKKFLQKTYATLVALVVMFAMSASMMAEEVVHFDGPYGSEKTTTQDVVTAYVPGSYLYYFGGIRIEVPSTYYISKVVFNGLVGWNSGDPTSMVCAEMNEGGAGAFEYADETATQRTWNAVGSTVQMARFVATEYNFMYVNGGFDVYYDEKKLDAAVTYTVNFVNAPDDAYVMLGDNRLTPASNTINSDNDYSVVSEVADSYDNVYANVTFDAASYTFTVTYLPYEVYTVVVEGYTSSSDAWSQPGFYDQSSYNNYKNGDVIKLKSPINEEYLFPQEFDGYNVELTVTGTDHNYTIKVTYTAKPAKTYEYAVWDAPEGAEVEIVLFEGTDDEIVLTDLEGTFETSRTVSTRSFHVTEIEGYKSEVSGEDDTFLITFSPLPKYTVTVTGAPEGEGGLMFSYVPYTDGQNFYYEWDIYEYMYSAIEVDGLEATVSYDDASKTFTVSYKKASFVAIDGTQNRQSVHATDANLYGLKLTSDFYYGYCNIWSNGYCNIFKGALNIEKIVFVPRDGYSISGIWCDYDDKGDFKYEFDGNTWTPSSNDWTKVTFGGGDNYIKAFRIYYKKDSVYDVKNVENIEENVTYGDEYRSTLDYNMDGKISVADINTLLNVLR